MGALYAVASNNGGSSSNFNVTPTNGGAYLSVPSILVTGDSTASQNDTVSIQTTGTTTVACTRYGRAFGWLDRLTGGALDYDSAYDPYLNVRTGSNAGEGGASMTSTLTKLTTGDTKTNNVPLLSRPEKYIWCQVGTNDLNAGNSLATMITNMTAIITAIINAGKIPIVTTILPRNNVDGGGGFDWGATGTTAAQKRQIMNSYNIWLAQYCRNLNVICISWHHVISNSTGDAITGYTVDGLHPNNRGGWYLAQEAYRTLAVLFPKSVRGQLNAYDVYDATYNPYGNIYNGDMSGTGGVTSDAGGTGAITGTFADNFQMRKNTSTTTSVVGSIVTKADGTLAQRLVFTSAGSGSATEEWRFNYWTGASTSLASYANSGDVIETACEFETFTGTLGVLKSLQIQAAVNNGITRGPVATISFDATTNTINDSGAGFTFPASMAVNVAGSASNNRVFKVVSATASQLVIDPSTPVTTEAAGASVTIRLPAATATTDSSTEAMPNVNSGILTYRAPIFIVPNTVSLSPRMAIFINGTVAGTTTIEIGKPFLGKRLFRPSSLSNTATD